MIETVIKRNGTEESFQPKKILDWVIWAEKDLGQKNVWWPVIVDVIGRLPAKVETRAITLELIEGFKNLGNWVGEMMAGRLYAIELLKEIYGEKNYPALKQVHDACWLESFMRKLDYTDEEYQELNDYIKHDLDLQLPHFAIEYMQHKYAIKNRVEKRVFETPQFIYMRMAMSLFEKEQDRELRMTQVKDMYDELAYKRVTAPTPNFTSQGTNRKASVSCVLYSSGDSADSISAGNHIAENCVTAGAGLGALLELRSAGDPIRNGEIIHEGKYFYYRAQSSLATQNKQGARGGALTMYFSIYDPEVEMLINLRNPRTPEARRNRLMHYAATHNNFFMRKVLLNETYFTFNVFTAPDLYEAQFDKDQTVFEELYAKYEADENFKKNYLNAREVFAMFVGEWLGTGTVYRMNLTNTNIHTPLLDPIKQSNLCVAPETLLLTSNGHVPIASLEEQDVDIWNGEEWSTVRVAKTGENQPLRKVILNDGSTLDCTEYHKWYIQETYHGKPVEKRTHELERGMKLIKFDFPVIEGYKELDRAYLNGFFTGDGTQLPNGQARIYAYGNKKDFSESIIPNGKWRTGTTDRLETEVRGLMPKFFVPNEEYTVSSRLEWLAGILDADGTVQRNGSNESIVLSSVNYDFMIAVKFMLSTLGVQSRLTHSRPAGWYPLPLNDGTGKYGEFWCNTSYRLLIASVETQKLLDLGLSTNRLKIDTRTPQRQSRHFLTIEEVLDEGRVSDTYCVTEPKRGMAVFNGILTGQCAEIVEHTRPYEHVKYLYDDSDHGKGEIATCNLAGINVAYLDVTEENEDVYAKAAYYALKMVDSTILNSVYPFPHMNFTSRQRMYAGVGMHGLATLLARNGLDPRTKEGLEYVHQVAERHMYHLIQASLRISKERGVAPWIHKTRWVDGWTPLDTYAKAVDRIQTTDGQSVEFAYRYDWKALSNEVKENGGIAHSLLVALMPGESSTKPVGVPNNFMMIREPVITKTDGDSKIQWVAPEAEELDYTIAWDMTLIEQARLVAVLQKFTDQAISAEFYRRVGKAETVPLSEIIEFAETCDLLGVKTWYYANTNTHTDNVGRSFLTAFNKPYYDEETMKLLHGEAALEKVVEACEGCDA